MFDTAKKNIWEFYLTVQSNSFYIKVKIIIDLKVIYCKATVTLVMYCVSESLNTYTRIKI